MNAYVAGLISIAALVRHWSVLFLWMGMLMTGLACGLLAEAGYRYCGQLGVTLVFGWVVMGSVYGFIAGTWWPVGLFAVGVVALNFFATRWEREPPVALSLAALAKKRTALLWIPGIFAAILGLNAGLAFWYDAANHTDHLLFAVGMSVGAAALLVTGFVLHRRLPSSPDEAAA